MAYLNQVLQGDCAEVLKELPDDTVDLIFTSPPYADQRKNTYGGISPQHYAEWFMPRASDWARGEARCVPVCEGRGGEIGDRSNCGYNDRDFCGHQNPAGTS